MLTILVDDLRDFKDSRDRLVARTSERALEVLKENRHLHIDELWLDHDLGMVKGVPDDTKKVAYELEEQAFNGRPYSIGIIYIHTSNEPAGESLVKGLRARGYNTKRIYAGESLRSQ